MLDLLILNGDILDGTGLPRYRADVGVSDGRISAIGPLTHKEAKVRLDAAGHVVAPGFVDAHVHGDLSLFEDRLHEPAIRQGVTTYILGQDGVAMAPASEETLDYMRRYTAGFSGQTKPPRASFSMAEYLDCMDRRSAVNIACLIPNGNIRMEVMGLETRPPTASELQKMRSLTREAMEQGAVGLSSGLDYIPSRYALTDELAELCEEIAPFGGVYVTHMRSYQPQGVRESMDEVFEIGRRAGCPVHISHFNSQAELVLPHLDQARRGGIDATYDLYCYLAGSTILGMIALPPWAQEGGPQATLRRLRDQEIRDEIRKRFTAFKAPLEEVRLSFIAAPRYRQYEGWTLGDAAESEGLDLVAFVCEVMIESELAVGCICPHLQRTEADVRDLIRHPAMMAGSDGIYTGGHPHPRGCGCFARYLGHYVREDAVWSLEQAVSHLSAHAARRFGLRDRGLLREGMAADVIVFDPESIADRSTYEDGAQLATGMRHVIVNGEMVLQEGERSEALPGRALRRI